MINRLFSLSPPPGVPTNWAGLSAVINRALQFVFAVAGVALLGLFIYGGFTWLTSAGDANKVKSAQGILINSGIGIAIVVCSAIIVRIFSNILGWNIPIF